MTLNIRQYCWPFIYGMKFHEKKTGGANEFWRRYHHDWTSRTGWPVLIKFLIWLNLETLWRQIGDLNSEFVWYSIASTLMSMHSLIASLNCHYFFTKNYNWWQRGHCKETEALRKDKSRIVWKSSVIYLLSSKQKPSFAQNKSQPTTTLKRKNKKVRKTVGCQ